MSFSLEDILAGIRYQLWDEEKKFIGLFETDEQAYDIAKKLKLQKYAVTRICITS